MRNITIEVPALPPKACSANSRAHWHAKYSASREYSEFVCYNAVSARNEWEERHKHRWVPLKKVTLQLTFEIPSSRKGPLPDPDNIIGSFKSGLDGLTMRPRKTLTGAGILVDDRVENVILLAPIIRRGPEERVLIEIHEVKP